jgi:hypothetical protein
MRTAARHTCTTNSTAISHMTRIVALATVAPPCSASSLSVEIASNPMKLSAAIGTALMTSANEALLEGMRTSNDRYASPRTMSTVAQPTNNARTVN